VTQNETMIEADARRFLLGEMSEDERNTFEGRFVADDELFQQIRVIEDELIESYVRGGLSPADKEKFERSFLTNERRRSRVAFTRTMLDKLVQQDQVAGPEHRQSESERPSVWPSIIGFFKTPQLAFGAVLALLILAFGAWFLLKSGNKTEVAREVTPTPTTQGPKQNQSLPPNQNDQINSTTNIPDNKDALPNVNSRVPEKNQNTNTARPDSTSVVPVLALLAGAVRAEGKLPELNLPKGASGANLELALKGESYKMYRAQIVDADGNPVFQSNHLKARNSTLRLFVPAVKLTEGDYMVKLSALNQQNESEPVADYPFRVIRK
jgi:hypothetical protein